MLASFVTFALLLSATAPPKPVTVTAYWENDSGYIKPNHPTDEHYTAGSMLLIAHEDVLIFAKPAVESGDGEGSG